MAIYSKRIGGTSAGTPRPPGNRGIVCGTGFIEGLSYQKDQIVLYFYDRGLVFPCGKSIMVVLIE